MVWQDYVFLVGAFVFALLLLPTLRDNEASVPLKTSVPTGTTLLVFSATFATLGMYLSAVGNLATAAAWYSVAVLRAPEGGDGE